MKKKLEKRSNAFYKKRIKTFINVYFNMIFVNTMLSIIPSKVCNARWQVHPQLLEQHLSAPWSQSASVWQAVTHRAAMPVAWVSGGQRPGRMLFTRRRNWHVSRHSPAYLWNVRTHAHTLTRHGASKKHTKWSAKYCAKNFEQGMQRYTELPKL